MKRSKGKREGRGVKKRSSGAAPPRGGGAAETSTVALMDRTGSSGRFITDLITCSRYFGSLKRPSLAATVPVVC